MSFTVKSEKSFTNDGDTRSSPHSGSVQTSTGLAHQKQNSLRGTKLARRARSFKDDFLEKISQIRTPTNTLSLGRSHSPNSPRNKLQKGNHQSMCSTDGGDGAKPIHDLNYHVRQVKNALQHFKDVISKNKLEVLPGNGTVVLESIANVHTALKTYTLNENSSAIISATTQVYLSLGKLIKLCDEVLLNEDNTNCASLSQENVAEVVELVDKAVENLVQIAKEKISERDNHLSGTASSNTLQRPIIEVVGQRTSLPDIPLTPRERDILEKSQTKNMRTSQSTESILRDSSPPPKPPLPNRISNPPPLPPKRRSQQKGSGSQTTTQPTPTSTADGSIIDSTLLSCVLDRMSLRSKSPDNTSLLSTSSLDSALNNSREEEELKDLTVDHYDEQMKGDIDKLFAQKESISIKGDVTDSAGPNTSINEIPVDLRNPRNSNESGFVSMHSIRASTQSVTAKRSSNENQQLSNISSSSVAANKSINLSNLSTASNSSFSSTSSATNSQFQQKLLSTFSNETFANMTNTVSSSSIATSSMGKLSTTTLQASRNFKAKENFLKMNSYETLSGESNLDAFENFASNTSMTSSSKNSIEQMLASNSVINDLVFCGGEDIPPVLPVKTRRIERLSLYDNVKEMDNVEEIDDFSNTHMLSFKNNCSNMMFNVMQSKHQSLIEPRRPNHFGDHNEQPPPLPVKKKHIMAYMEMFGNCSHSTHNTSEFLRHSMHTYNVNHSSAEHITATQQHNRSISHSQTMSLSPLRRQIIMESSGSPTSTPIISISSMEKPDYLPPALPPKRQRINSKSIINLNTPPSSPKLILTDSIESTTNAPSQNNQHNNNNNNNNNSNTKKMSTVSPSETFGSNSKPLTPVTPTSPSVSSNNSASIVSANTSSVGGRGTNTSNNVPDIDVRVIYSNDSANNQNAINNRSSDENHYIQLYDSCNDDRKLYNSTETEKCENECGGSESNTHKNSNNNNNNNNGVVGNDEDIVVLRHAHNTQKALSNNASPAKSAEPNNLIEEIDIQPHLVLKKEGEDGPDIKGGNLDALIVHASKVQKVSENAFGEAFITTFRTFITPLDLIEKLIHRYTVFCCQINDQKQKSAKESFSLLVRVVNDLTAPDLTPHILGILNEFVYQLVCSGQLMMAKLLRNNILEKIALFKQQKWTPLNPILSVITNQPTLLELKSADIAEQMTLLDAELFQKIEIPEVLIWAQEQCEERSPNLTRFTEHFNKMSFWARSQILKQEDSKDREKHVIKFIKIMKHLRKINNYNSYLALLSALDSAPIRRLEWHKTITEGLKEYCALIDSSSSFRAYRQALAETNPPCIPYIGLVLQDLTFVHIGNQDCINPGIINFSKRWQQHNIVVNMKRFKKCSAYPFSKNPRIIGFFDNFENHLDEDAMWQISESIKPRISRKPLSQAH